MAFISCSKEDAYLTPQQENALLEYMDQVESWSVIFIDRPLIPFSAFAPETKSIQTSSAISLDSKELLDGFIMDLEIPNDRYMHDWLIGYGKLIRDIKVDNVLPADENFYRSLTERGIHSTDSNDCIIKAHMELQRHAYNKANSYDATVQSVSGPAFDLNNFMTLRGIGSALYRIHRFIDNRNSCS